MTVGELVTKLSLLDPDAVVCVKRVGVPDAVPNELEELEVWQQKWVAGRGGKRFRIDPKIVWLGRAKDITEDV
jgi:hypothetical protein